MYEDEVYGALNYLQQQLAEESAAREQLKAEMAAQHQRQLQTWALKLKMEEMARLKERYPDLDEQKLWQATAEVGRQWNTTGPNLDHVHRLMTYDEAVKKAGERSANGWGAALRDARYHCGAWQPRG